MDTITARDKMETIGQRLKELRDERFLSRAELAKKAGVSVSTVTSLEQNKPAQRRTIRKLAEALDVEPSELVR